MHDKEIAELIELLYPHFLKKIKADGIFKSCVKSKNAKVSWVDPAKETTINAEVKIKFPYDSTEIAVLNKSGLEVKKDDLVCVHYNIDLKNAYIAYKV